MAQRVVVAMPVEWASQNRMPAVCAYSGRLATTTKRYRAVGDRPKWTLLLLLPAVIPYLLLSGRWGTMVRFQLPIARSTRWRWTVANAITVSALVLSADAFVLAAREHNQLLLYTAAGHFVVFAFGIVAAFGRQQVPRVKRGMLILPCVHPAFAEAVQHAFAQTRRAEMSVVWDGSALTRYPTLSESLAS